jgi:hypothetical protein
VGGAHQEKNQDVGEETKQEESADDDEKYSNAEPF